MASLLIALIATGRSVYLSHKKRRDEKQKNSPTRNETWAKSSAITWRGRRKTRKAPNPDNGQPSKRNASHTVEDDAPRLSQQSTLADKDAYAGG